MNARDGRTSRTRRVLVALGADERVSWAVLASDIGITSASLTAYKLGRAPFPAEAIPALFRALCRVDRALALWALSEMAGLREIAHTAKPLPGGTDGDDPATDAMQVGEALGVLLGMLARHGPTIEPHEAAEQLPTWRAIEREAVQGRVKVETIAGIGPQRALHMPEAR
jgi:hypothetical protein